MDYPDSPDLFEGKFTDGDPVAGRPASVASAEHMNAVYDELLNVITFAGITPATETKNQLKEALDKVFFPKKPIDISQGDIFSDREAGFYIGTQMANSPGGSGEWFYITVQRFDSSNLFVIATTLTRSTQVSYRASCVAGKWSGWDTLLTDYNTGTAVSYDVTSWSDDQNIGRLLQQGDRAIDTHVRKWEGNIDDIAFSSPHILCSSLSSSSQSLPFDLENVSIKSMVTSTGIVQFLHKNGVCIIREKVNGEWADIEYFSTSKNFVGEISSGAVIETGSNVNGVFTKFADGTMICRSIFVAASDDFAVSFPSVFVDAPALSLCCIDDYNPRVVSASGVSQSEFLAQGYNPSLVPVSPQISYIALGSWL